MTSNGPSDSRLEPKCASCGGPIGSSTLESLCCKCLLGAAIQAPHSDRLDDTGQEFGDYILGREIGRGGMGVVYEATQKSLRRKVAIKMIRDSHTFSSNARRDFRLEAEAIARLDHPNIVPVHEVSECGDQPYLAMKLIDGQSLLKKMAEGEFRLPPSGLLSRTEAKERMTIIARFVSRVAQAVHHAHQRKVLHRDLKPANILVDKSGAPHLTDFGLAKLLEDGELRGSGNSSTDSSRIIGTPAYMSPEQASSKRLTPASDVYSLGAILYEMLTGRVPFKGQSVLETVRLLTEQEPRPPRSINSFIHPDLERVCLKCLEKNPAARYTSALALAQDLECWLRSEPVRARPVGPAGRVQRWVKRNPVGTGLICSLCACLAMTLVLLQGSRDRERETRDRSDMVTEQLNKQLDELWRSPSRRFVEVSSTQLAALLGQPVHRTGPGTLHLDFAVSIENSPLAQAVDLAPFLRYLEEQLKRRLKCTVLINLRLYNMRVWAYPAIAHREAHVQLISPVAFVRLQDAGATPRPLFRGRRSAAAVIFAREDSGITAVDGIRGRRMAFAHTNALISCFAKLVLSTNGIAASNLQRCVYFDRNALRYLGFDDGMVESEFTFAHEAVIKKVLAGEFDVGVASRERFEEQRRKGLVELCSYEAPPDWFVAASDLPPAVATAIEQIVFSMTDQDRKEKLGRWHRAMVVGAARISDQDVADVRRAIRAQETFFRDAQEYVPGNVPAAAK